MLRMNSSGAIEVEIPNGASPPAITSSPGTEWMLAANAFTSVRYQAAVPGLSLGAGTLFGSFQACQMRTRGSPSKWPE